jgi:succinate dehydrogenase/fumarate reductase iron-sulfur protein
MSSYIPPIEPEKTFTLHIRRYDPDQDKGSHWESFQVPWVPTMTVIEALEWLTDQGRYVAFRANCREFTCGSCAMRINGKPGLACDTPFTDQVRLEPLTRYPVKRDLVVETSAVREQWKELRLWPHLKASKPLDNVPASSMEGWHRAYARCIECYVCLDACPASDSESSQFVGPMWMLQIARARAHPLDGVERLDQAAAKGVGRCVSCFECAGVCPVDISPIFEIQGLRWDLIIHRIKLWLSKIGLAGLPHGKRD